MSDLICISIGVSKYEKLENLPGAVNGANEFASWAKAAGYETYLLTDESNKAVTMKQITCITDELVVSGRCKRIIVYFAGHGALLRGNETCALLTDYHSVRGEAISVPLSRYWGNKSGIKQISFIMDACRNYIKDSTGYSGDSIFPIDALPRGAAQPYWDQFYACKLEESSQEVKNADPKKNFGIFSKVLMEGLWGKATDPRDRTIISTPGIELHLRETVPVLSSSTPGAFVQYPDTDPGWMSPDDVYVEVGKVIPPSDGEAAAPTVAPDSISVREDLVATEELVATDAEIAAKVGKKTSVYGSDQSDRITVAVSSETGGFTLPNAIAAPIGQDADDLTAIKGIGPKIASLLMDMGIFHFAQIADWSREETRLMDMILDFKGRVERDDWVSQADFLRQTEPQALDYYQARVVAPEDVVEIYVRPNERKIVQDSLRRQREYDAQFQSLTSERGRGAFETRHGMTILGGEIRSVKSNFGILVFKEGSAHQIRCLEDASEDLAHTVPQTILIELSSGDVVVTTSVPGLIGTLDIKGGNVSSFSYMPSFGVDLYRYDLEQDAPENLTKATRQWTTLRHLGRKANPGLLTDTAEKLRRLKHKNPVLGIFAAHAYARAGRFKDVLDLAHYFPEFGQPIPIDIAMLAGGQFAEDGDGFFRVSLPAYGHHEDRNDCLVCGHLPLYLDTWAYRDVGQAPLHFVNEIVEGLGPSIWTVLTQNAAKILEQKMSIQGVYNAADIHSWD